MAVSTRAAGNSVSRNRLRRLIRESFRMHRQELPAVDVLVTARAGARAAYRTARSLRAWRALWQRDRGGKMNRIAQLPIHLYRWFLSPFLGRHCRFHPTCSAYALEAIEETWRDPGLWIGGEAHLPLPPLGRGGP